MAFPIIDAHQHIWDKSKAEYSWLTPEFGELDRVFEIDELLPQLSNLDIDFTVLVQSADNHEDTQLMRQCANLHPQVSAIVGYVPLERPEEAAETLASWTILWSEFET
jgi:L-fuconolactonase